MTTRSQLDAKTVATVKALLATPKGIKTLAMVRARYYRAMNALGIADAMTQYYGFNDCCDIAELELIAA